MESGWKGQCVNFYCVEFNRGVAGVDSCAGVHHPGCAVHRLFLAR